MVCTSMATIEKELRELEDITGYKCAYPPCGCTADSGLDFCSRLCEQAQPRMQESCPCGHVNCIGEFPKSDSYVHSPRQ